MDFPQGTMGELRKPGELIKGVFNMMIKAITGLLESLLNVNLLPICAIKIVLFEFNLTGSSS